jgi:hypothetical protein
MHDHMNFKFAYNSVSRNHVRLLRILEDIKFGTKQSQTICNITPKELAPWNTAEATIFSLFIPETITNHL